MEEAFQDLLRLIWEGSCALSYKPCPCLLTARAYLKMAEASTFKLLEHATNDDEYKRLREVCNYSERVCLQMKTWTNVAHFMTRFWLGVNDGFFDNTLSITGKYYERGYKLIRYGK